MLVSRSHRARSRRGFTLIELVVVLLIIATLAGLVIPIVAMLTRSSDMAASAKTQADLANNIQLYFALQKRYPTGFDSLLVGDGTDATEVYTPVSGADGLQTSGLPDSGPHLDEDLVLETLTSTSSSFGRSFSRSGFEHVFDHDRSVVNSNDSGIHQRAVGADFAVAKVASESAVAAKLLPLVPGQADGYYDETKYMLVALGVGPNNDMIGKTNANPPIYPGCDGAYYGRYVAIFKLFNSGERATLLGVVDAYGRAPDYTQQQFNESLPNDARRG